MLRSIAPCTVGVAVAFDNQTVETEVHSLLTKRCDEFALTTDVAGIADDRQVRDAATQLDGDMPLRQIAVQLLVVTAETAMDGCQTFQSGIVDTLQCADPEFQIRVYRVLHKHRNIHTLQCIGNFLHGKRVGSGACTNPKDIDTCFQTLVYML